MTQVNTMVNIVFGCKDNFLKIITSLVDIGRAAPGKASWSGNTK